MNKNIIQSSISLLSKIVLLLFLLGFTQLSAQDLSIFTIPEKVLKGANAVVRFDDVSIEILNQEKMRIHIKKAISIF